MTTRRDFIKKTAYAAPVIMTLSARPSFAGQGSDRGRRGNRTSRRRRRQRNRSWFRRLFGGHKKKKG